MAKEMTKREFLNAVAESEIDESLVEFAKAEIAKMDAVNAKRAGKKSKEQSATDKIVFTHLTNEEVKASALAKAITEEVGEKYSTSKVQASLKRLANGGKVAMRKKDEGSKNVYLYKLA